MKFNHPNTTPLIYRSIILGLLCYFSAYHSLAQAPGGVNTDLNYWLKADAGVATFDDQTVQRVSNWDNQVSGSANGLSGMANSERPVFIENGLNFNPSINFDGTDDFLRTDDGWDSHTVVIVFNPSDVVSTTSDVQAVLVYDIPNNSLVDAGMGIGNLGSVSSIYSDCNESYFWNSGDQNITGIGRPPEYIGCSGDAINNPTDDPILGTVRTNVTETMPEHRLWGQDQTTIVINPQEYGVHSNRPFTIGQRHGGGIFYNGDVLEAISYSSRVSDVDLNKIESYLALKYGLTLDQSVAQDYVSSSGISIFDADPSFSFNIAGIGRDDASALHQKQSISNTTDAVHNDNVGIVTIGLGEITATNLNNPNSFSRDVSFLMWGNNGASTNIDIAMSLTHNGVNSIERMSRVWKTQQTGIIDNIRLSIPQSFFTNTPLLISGGDSNFNSLATVYQMTDDGAGNYIADIEMLSGSYFTFAQQEAPIDCGAIIALDQTFSNGQQLSYAAAQSAIVTSLHNDGSAVSIRAPNHITLDFGFTVLEGAEFQAIIGGCP